jgi:hypothetical protein
MWNKILILGFLSQSLWSQSAVDPTLSNTKSNVYQLKDLEVLQQEFNYQEFFMHAMDILPSQRNKYWKKMVTNMAESYLKDLKNQKHINQSDFTMVLSLSKWPVVKNNEFFRTERIQVLRKYFTICLQEKREHCSLHASQIWLTTTDDFELGLLLLEKFEHAMPLPLKIESFDLIYPSLVSKISTFLCRKHLVQKHAFAWLKDLTHRVPREKLSGHILGRINTDCWNELSAKLQLTITSENTIEREYAYTLLFATNGLTKEQQDLYYTLYLLEGPSKGDTYNRAWNRMNELGKSHQRRNRVLQKIKQLNNLPGQVFEMDDKKHRQTLIKQISQNFPEYFDHMSRACMDYFQGKANNGPSLHCHHLLKSEIKGIVPQAIKDQYQQIKL